MTLSARDTQFLRRCLELAEEGRGRTSPNPMVGAVVVRDGRVLGEGSHAGPGHDHAEVVAIKAATGGGRPPGGLAGATVYVSLEPCCHHGRTPPCTEALIAAGIARVVVAAIDPSPKVDGRGVERLRRAGIRVDLAGGDLEYEARRQNDPFRKMATVGMPFVTYKWAMSVDGRTSADGGDSRWISGEQSRRAVHRMRASSDAVMIGAGTLRRDDPRLTARGVEATRQPLRVLVDAGLTISQMSTLVKTLGEGPVLAVCSREVAEERRREVASWGIEVATVSKDVSGLLLPREVAGLLAAREVQSVLLEGGRLLAASWWSAGLIDRVVVFVAPVVIGGLETASALKGPGCPSVDEATRLKDVEIAESGEDVMISGYVRGPH